jgi:hypothetical protein
VVQFPSGKIITVVNNTFNSLTWNTEANTLYGSDLTNLYFIDWEKGTWTVVLSQLNLIWNSALAITNNMLYMTWGFQPQNGYFSYVVTYDIQQGNNMLYHLTLKVW